VPFTDIYSFTRAGEPWISTSWLAQVLFAQAFDVGGGAGAAAGAYTLLVASCHRYRSAW
jgi:ABC-type sugar transport system permease subunit